MQLQEIINRLTDMAEDIGYDAEVKGAFQPNYPLVASVLNICADENKKQVFIALAEPRDYGIRAMWDETYIDDEDDDEEDE